MNTIIFVSNLLMVYQQNNCVLTFHCFQMQHPYGLLSPYVAIVVPVSGLLRWINVLLLLLTRSVSFSAWQRL